MSQIKKLIKELEKNEEFKDWKKENYASSLVHFFKMFDEANKDECQIGYYNSDDTITAFILGDNCIKIMPKSEIFKKPDYKIKKLNVEDIKIDLDEALEAARKLQKEEYPTEKPMKEMLILQNIEIGQVYNITFFTKSFKTLNIKIDASTCKIISHDLASLISKEK